MLNLKSVLIIVLIIFLLALCFKCAMMEKFESEIERQTTASTFDPQNITVELSLQNSYGKFAPTGVKSYSQLSKRIDFQPSDRFNINTTQPV